MIEWNKYLWECDWSKENDIFDRCQVLSQHESETDSQRFWPEAFLSVGSALRSALRVANFQIKQIILKESLWDQKKKSKCNLFTHGALRSLQELVQKCPCIPESNWNLEILVFKERGKRSTRRKTSRSRVENQQQTQPTYDAGSGNRTWATLVGGERSHHCANPAPLWKCVHCGRTH